MDIAFDKFAIGQPVRRTEDPLLLRGEGTYSDDLRLPGLLHAVVLRSPYPHARLHGLAGTAARTMPGVKAVITAADLAAYKDLPGNTGLKNHDGSSNPSPPHPALAAERVRYVGEPIAVVVADTLAQAQDAAEAITPEMEPLPAVTDDVAALRSWRAAGA